MHTLYKKAALLLIIPFFINVIISMILFKWGEKIHFRGYLTGTVTSACLSVIWLLQVKNRGSSNILNFMKMMLKGYAVKIISLIALLIGGYLLFNFHRFYFIIAFFLGTFASIAVEVWYYISVSKDRERVRENEKP